MSFLWWKMKNQPEPEEHNVELPHDRQPPMSELPQTDFHAGEVATDCPVCLEEFVEEINMGFFFKKLLRLYAIEFCNLHRVDELKNFAANILLKLVVNHVFGSVHQLVNHALGAVY
nr:hypothetical protein CFP56_47385 [Quercus suber]